MSHCCLLNPSCYDISVGTRRQLPIGWNPQAQWHEVSSQKVGVLQLKMQDIFKCISLKESTVEFHYNMVQKWYFIQHSTDKAEQRLGMEVTQPISSILLFPALSKRCLSIEYHVPIWQVSLQLSCSDNCQIGTWFTESNRYLYKMCLTEKIMNGALVTPQVRPGTCRSQVSYDLCCVCIMEKIGHVTMGFYCIGL